MMIAEAIIDHTTVNDKINEHLQNAQPTNKNKKPKPYVVFLYDIDGSFKCIDIVAATSSLSVPKEMLRHGYEVSTDTSSFNYPRVMFELEGKEYLSAEERYVGVWLKFVNPEKWFMVYEILNHAHDFIGCLIEHGVHEIYCTKPEEKEVLEAMVAESGFRYPQYQSVNVLMYQKPSAHIMRFDPEGTPCGYTRIK